jgi:hypothetical protein
MPRSLRKLARTPGTACLALFCGLALAAALAHAQSTAGPTLRTARGCYLVGEYVELDGSGFAPDRRYVVTIDGVYLGASTSDANGNFAVPVRPGGLPADAAEHVDQVQVSDGTNSAHTTFTLTRATGARVITSGGNPSTLRGRFQIWGFSLAGLRRHVYLHYVAPGGHAHKAVLLGHTRGQCGYLRTAPRRLFPFSPSAGTWTLQLDTKRSYVRHPRGPVARIRVAING